MSINFKWFLALSVAAHAAAVFTWVAPLPDAGMPGQVLLLDIMEKAGQTTSLEATDTVGATGKSGATAKQHAPPRKPVPATRRTISKRMAVANTASSDAQQAVSADSGAMKPERTANHAASSRIPSADETDRHLRNSVLQLVTQRLSYPAIARRKGWQGVVTLELHIEPDGFISDLQVSETSGYPALDQAAMKSLQMAVIPGAGQWLHGRSIDMLVPVEYRLLES